MHRRQHFAHDRPASGLGGLDAGERRLIIGARLVRAVECLVERQVGNRHRLAVRDERERLTDRQADDARQLQLGLLEVVPRRRDALALGAELHLRAQDVDAGDQAACLQIRRLLEERLGRVALRARRVDARRGGQRLQVGVGRDEHDEIARALVTVLRGLDVVRFGAGVVQGVQVEDRLRERHPRVEDVERSDDRRDALGQREAERRQVHDLPRLRDMPLTFGSSSLSASFCRPAAASTPLFGQQQPEVVLERPVDRVEQSTT